MNSTRELLHQIGDPTHTPDERAHLRCHLAKQLEDLGNYEAAREAMGNLWEGVGERPIVKDLDSQTSAEILLRVGALTGWIGSIQQIEGAQATSKDLITESMTIFMSAKRSDKVAEAEIELAYCYWREGAFDEARVMLQEAMTRLRDSDKRLKAIALLRSTLVETSAKRLHDALRIHTEAVPLFETIASDALKGRFHYGFAMLLKKLGISEQRKDYIDRALIEYAAASFYFEQAGLSRYQACVENNLGFLIGTIGKFREAHEHLDRAQALFTSLNDKVHLAQVDETRARVLIAEKRIAEAERVVRPAVKMLEKGGEQSLLAEALTTQGIAHARMHHQQQAYSTLMRAVKVGEDAGDSESAGLAALVIIEELSAEISNDNLVTTVQHAWDLLSNTQDMSTLKRLITCACKVVELLHIHPGFPPSVDWKNFSLKQLLHRYEAHFIELALTDADGSVTQAAHLLGLGHHQNLGSLLNRRHKNLRKARRRITPRRRSIIPKLNRSRSEEADRKPTIVRILHVEDNQVVADAVKETLEVEGWEVDTCAEGSAGLKKILSNARYDLLLLDDDLPGLSGIELVRRARSTGHRKNTPIIVLSAALGEAAAREAGANKFLHKPEDVSSIVKTIRGLLRSAEDLKT